VISGASRVGSEVPRPGPASPASTAEQSCGPSFGVGRAWSLGGVDRQARHEHSRPVGLRQNDAAIWRLIIEGNSFGAYRVRCHTARRSCRPRLRVAPPHPPVRPQNLGDPGRAPPRFTCSRKPPTATSGSARPAWFDSTACDSCFQPRAAIPFRPPDQGSGRRDGTLWIVWETGSGEPPGRCD
jgi:hypothetical protein